MEKAKEKTVTVYWWNFGTKTLDYTGTYQGYMDKKDIIVEPIVHPRFTKIKGLRFIRDWGTATFIYESYNTDTEKSYFNAIQMFLVVMGDRAKIICDRWEVTVNK